MHAITTQGKKVEVRPGQAVCGMRFTSVTLTAEDMEGNEKRVMDWFLNTVYVRLKYNYKELK